MIALTCTNGERRALDPDHVERIESRPDTAVVMVDGAHYVVDETVDQVLSAMREHRARRLVQAQRQERRGSASPLPAAPTGAVDSAQLRASGLVTRGHCQLLLSFFGR